ncbi:MAG TPA: hypothetical protein DCP92_19345 [Nitrospiraceae bacterium]|nr:hypothetical protein [Nitrospiraceae bacterium]
MEDRRGKRAVKGKRITGNCMIRLLERTEGGLKADLFRLYIRLHRCRKKWIAAFMKGGDRELGYNKVWL